MEKSNLISVQLFISMVYGAFNLNLGCNYFVVANCN